jgi:short-subunit dehydrogenase
MDFGGKTAVITGASGAVGAAIARTLADRGAALCLLGRRVEALREFGRSAAGSSAPCRCFPVDLADARSIETAAGALAREFDGVDVLIHSAGSLRVGGIEALTLDESREQFQVNLLGPYQLTRALLPALRRSRGQVLFVNSSAALNPRSRLGPYAAAKAGLKAIADSLRDEINEAEVRVTSLFLGRTASAMQAQLHLAEGAVYRPEALIQPDDVAAAALLALSLPPTAEITDLHIRPFIHPKRR